MLQHKHVLINALVDSPLQTENEAKAFLENLVESIDMKIVAGPFASYVEAPGNRGLTAIVMIETSHIAFHIWDEKNPAVLQFDLYTCGELNVELVLETIKRQFDVVSMDYRLYDRETGFVLEKEGNYTREETSDE